MEILFGDEDGSTVRTRSGQSVPVSRRYLPPIQQRLGI